jgi:hypothetical protein
LQQYIAESRQSSHNFPQVGRDKLATVSRTGKVHPERLDRRTLNRATLARQLLLERVDRSVFDVVQHLVGLQAQAPLAPYVALWSRVAGFDPFATGTMLENGLLVRTHAMRATVHLFTRRDALTLRPLLQPMLAARFASSPFPKLLPGLDLVAVCRQAKRVATPTALTRSELGRLLAVEFPGAPTEPLAYAATYLEPLAQVPPRGVWGQRSPVRWQTFRGWLGADPQEPARIDDVVRRYFAAFGPASVADLRTWSGLTGLREVTDRLRPELRMFLDDQDRELFDVPDAPRPDPGTPAPVRFLPEYDNLLLSHADRRRVIPDSRVIPLPPGEGARTGTVLVDGDFRATWSLSNQGSRTLVVRPRPSLSAEEEEQVRAEGNRLLSFLHPDSGSDDAVMLR